MCTALLCSGLCPAYRLHLSAFKNEMVTKDKPAQENTFIHLTMRRDKVLNLSSINEKLLILCIGIEQDCLQENKGYIYM
jgi:hypothetical protein